MQTSTRKGRPPVPPQTMPAFLKSASNRTMRELPMSVPTAKAIDEYIEWSSARAQMQKHEALYRFIDHVLGDFIRRDGLWQAERGKAATAQASDSGVPDSPTSPGTIVSPPPTARAEKGGAPSSPSRTEVRGNPVAAGAAGKAG
jgi:hypothetical protein